MTSAQRLELCAVDHATTPPVNDTHCWEPETRFYPKSAGSVAQRVLKAQRADREERREQRDVKIREKGAEEAGENKRAKNCESATRHDRTAPTTEGDD